MVNSLPIELIKLNNNLISKIFCITWYQNPLINLKDNFIFIHIPKNAGTSFRLQNNIEERAHIPIKRYYYFNKLKTRKLIKIAIIREPVDRFKSSFSYVYSNINSPYMKKYKKLFYQYKINNFYSFCEQFLSNKIFRNKLMNMTHFLGQYFWIENNNEVITDFLIDYCNIENDIKNLNLLFNLNIKFSKTTKHNNTNYKNKILDNHYDDLILKIVEQFYSKDKTIYSKIKYK